MWIEPYKDKYRAIERYTDPMTGKTRRVSTIIDKNTKQVRKAAEELLRAKIEGADDIQQDADITLEEIETAYINHQMQVTREQTWKRDKSVIKCIVSAIGKDSIANRLTARFVVNRISQTNKPHVTQNSYISHFKRMIRWAYTADLVEDISYLAKIKPLPDKEKKLRTSEKYLDSKELKQLLDEMKIDRWKLLTQFLALSGLRIGEALALNDEDVKDYIVVAKTVDVKTGTVFLNAKTDAGNRSVFVQPELATVIRKIRTYVKKELLASGNRSEIFFPDSEGNYLNYYSYNKYLKENTIIAIGRPLTPHALRHTHVSLLAEQGYPLEAISRRVGHDDSKVTKEIYLHVTDRQKKRDEEQMKNMKFL